MGHAETLRIPVMNVIVDTNEYISDLQQMITDGHEVVITVAGWSMRPFLRHQRDRIMLKKPADSLKVGDIVLYQRKTKQFVLHRIYKIKSGAYYMMGDNQLDLEGPIGPESVIALVSDIERNGRWISAETPSWKMASSLWRLLYPVRKIVCWARKAVRK